MVQDDSFPATTAPRVSRRAFLAASGVIVGTSVNGVVGATSREQSQPVVVEATPPYLPAARAFVSTYEQSADGASVRLRPTEQPSADRLLDGTPDVQFAGRPATTSVSADESERLVQRVGVRGWSALKHPDGEWRECLRPREVREQWTSGGPVETWSESDWRAVPDGVRGPTRTGALSDRSADHTVFVRGTRSYQYARGLGGVGYYRVGPETIDGRARRSDSTPVARLEYVNVDPAARGQRGVDALLQFYDRRVPGASDAGGQFLDPAVQRVH